MRGLKVLGLIFSVLLVYSIVNGETFGVKKRMPKPHEYGNIVIDNYSTKKNIAPVVFNHWLHRAKYTCRLCHVDIGFAMKAGGTGITELDNISGLYCGTCHNGREAFSAEERHLTGETTKNCDRCHSYGKKVKFKYNFYKYTRGFPRARFGNRIDWLKAEERGLIKLKDYIEGVSIKRKALKIPKDTELKAKEESMPDIIFSHKKHAVWNGCELCHPDIFGVRKGATKFTMQDIFDGKYCGACHGKVAFPNYDCQLCHSKEVY